MAGYPYAELEEMVQRWLAANRAAQEAGDWRPMAEMYTEDATYGWNIGPHEEFMAVGRDEIRAIALGLEMGGLDGWTYPYQKAPAPTAPRTRSPAWAGAGSATPATGAGRGSATSSTWATPPPCSSR